MLERFDVDVRYVSPVYPPDVISNGVKQNMWGERWMMANTPWGKNWEHVNGVLADVSSLGEIEAFSWPSCDDVDYSSLAQQCDRYDGYAIAYGNADIFERQGAGSRMGKLPLRFLAEPGLGRLDSQDVPQLLRGRLHPLPEGNPGADRHLLGADRPGHPGGSTAKPRDVPQVHSHPSRTLAKLTPPPR